MLGVSKSKRVLYELQRNIKDKYDVKHFKY